MGAAAAAVPLPGAEPVDDGAVTVTVTPTEGVVGGPIAAGVAAAAGAGVAATAPPASSRSFFGGDLAAS